MDRHTKTVYHYCSNETFMSILSNLTLRVTNIKKSNDYTEIVNCLDLFQRSLRIACYRFNKTNPEDSEFAQFYHEADIATLVERSIMNDTLTYYAVCFSEAGDSLSQWRGYADNATGVAIGFDRQYLDKATDRQNMKFMEVEYNKQNVEEDLVNYVVNKFEQVKKDLGVFVTTTHYGNAISQVLTSFVYNAAFYKNAAFAEEKELRLVFYPFGNIQNLYIRHQARDMSSNQLYYDRMFEYLQKERQYGPFIRKPLSFGLRRNNIFSYFDLDFSSIAPFFVQEIVLGPKNNMDDLDLRLFLLSKGFDVANIKIIRSTATYQ